MKNLERLALQGAQCGGVKSQMRPAGDACRRGQNHSFDAGNGARTFFGSKKWHATLLGTVAAGALLLGYGRSVRAQVVPPAAPCDTIAGTTATCTGDVSAGIATGAPFTVLNVNALTTDIAPASGVDGINFTSTGDATIISDTTPFAIDTVGDNAEGILATTTSGAVTVTQTGDITTGGDFADGIHAYSATGGDTMVTQTGDITTTGRNAQGIYAYADDGGAVTVTQTGNITTGGDFAQGIYVYSDSGGALTVTQTGDITTGGQNADGIFGFSKGSDVTVTQTGDIATTGNFAEGIIAHSTSGAVTVTQTGDIATAGILAEGISAYAIGSGDVTVVQTGGIATTGFDSAAIIAVADSGDVEVTQEGTITTTEEDSEGINAFSQSGNITVIQKGTITTEGNDAEGISALHVDGAATVTVIQTGDITISGGGHGRNGISARSADAGTIMVTQTGNIATAAENAAGIYGKSKYGDVTITQTGDIATKGEGALGIKALSFRYGDFGTPIVGATGDITVTQTGDIATKGEGAMGIYAYSYRYGNVTVTQTGDIVTEGGDSHAIRAVVESGTVGGDVTVTQTGNIVTSGDFADGIHASSRGLATVTQTGDIKVTGDGSSAIYSYGVGDVTVTQTGDIVAMDTGISASSSKGDVTVKQKGNITTLGAAIFAQSGFGLGSTGSVSVEQTGNLTTTGAFGHGIFAEASQGDGTVTITQTGNIATEGDNARGISGITTDGELKITQTGTIATKGVDAHGIETFSFNGDVSVTQNGTITTGGESAMGILAVTRHGKLTVDQIGDIETKGLGADAVNALTTTGDIMVMRTGDIATFGNNAEGITANSTGGGDVTVKQIGNVTTAGDSAETIYAYAPGGGNIMVDVTGNLIATGLDSDGIFAEVTGGNVTVLHTGDIMTEQDGSDGILALQNVPGGTAKVVHSGDILVKGIGAEGIYARTVADGLSIENTGDVTSEQDEAILGRSTSGNMSMTLMDGAILGGTHGVQFSGGVTNTLTTRGIVSVSGGTTDILGGAGDEAVHNYGTLTTSGDIDLGAGTNSFTNHAGAVFHSGTTVNIGDGNTLTNDGIVSPHGLGTIGTTTHIGHFVHNDGAVHHIDIDMAGGLVDLVDMTTLGTETLSLAGDLALNFANITTPPQSFLIFDTSQAISVQGLEVLNPVVLANITYPGGEDAQLNITGFDFAPAGLNQNRTAIGDNLDAIFDEGSGALGDVLAGLASLPTLADVTGALDQLSPEIYLDTQIAAQFSSLDFSSNLLSCGINELGALSVNREGQCLWVAFKGRHLNSDRTSESIGFDETAWQVAGGGQVALDPVWRLGFGAGYQSNTLDTDTGATSEGELLQGGVTVKYNPGALLLAGVVSGGRGWYDTTRPMAFDGFAATAEGKQDLDIFAGRVHASYVLGDPDLYFKPLIDAAATYVDAGNLTETGADDTSLVVHGDANTVFSVSPALEVGTQWWQGNGNLIRGFVRAGATWLSDDNVTLTASFAGAPIGVAPFKISAQRDQLQADVTAGFELTTIENTSFSLFYEGHIGDTTQVHGGGLKASLSF